MDYPSTRKEAKEMGATHYYTGVPCIRGHIALRKTKGSCIECVKEDWVIDNENRKGKPKSEAAKAAARRYYAKNREAILQRRKERKQQKEENRPPQDDIVVSV